MNYYGRSVIMAFLSCLASSQLEGIHTSWGMGYVSCEMCIMSTGKCVLCQLGDKSCQWKICYVGDELPAGNNQLEDVQAGNIVDIIAWLANIFLEDSWLAALLGTSWLGCSPSNRPILTMLRFQRVCIQEMAKVLPITWR